MIVSKSENAFPHLQQIKSLAVRQTQFRTFLKLKKVPEHQQIILVAWQHWLFTFPNLKSRFLCIKKSKFIHVGTAHIWTFHKLITQLLCMSKKSICGTELPIFECYGQWKRDSWSSANRPPFRIALLISVRFTTSKRHSWQSANRSPNTAHM